MASPIAQVFRFCPRCGEEGAESGKNPFRCPACGFTQFFSPIAAVGAIIQDSDRRVLFVRRAKDPGKGKLGLPGGFVDPGETAEHALRRETLEEANLRLVEIRYLTSFPNDYAYNGVEFPVTDLFYVCRVESFESLRPEEGEIAGFHLAVPGKEELADMAFESNRRALVFHLGEER